jgi:heat shock protein HtpX
MRLAVSRKREFLADAGSVELTKDNEAMIAALRKISGHSSVPSAKEHIAMFFIESPTHIDSPARGRGHEVPEGAVAKKSSIWDTHPSIDERIAMLKGF